MPPDDPIEFLTVDDVLLMHAEGLARWGGLDGLRDRGALESAMAQPGASFGDEYLHGDLFSMAAAYAFHIGESQAFVDGNKRTAVLAAVTFLAINGFLLPDPGEVVYLAMIEIAQHTMTKAQLAQLLREIAGV